jgi:hypothetical protein
LGAGVAIAIASAATGYLLGFLFGISRSLQGGDSSESNSQSFPGNTNLEQISDWLTKILVGVGLV